MSGKKKRYKKRMSGASPRESLPDEIIPIPCSDKEDWIEHWYPTRNLLNIPHSFAGLFIGSPSSGKSTMIKNIILRCRPAFKEILIYHFDKDGSKEWDDIGGEYLDDFPDPLGFDRDKKRILIMEDLNIKQLSKENRGKLNRLFGYTRSHCNLSICITTQSPFDIDPNLRRMCNLLVMWKSPDMNSLKTLASRTGLKSKHIEYIMLYLLKQPHDSLMIDLQRNSPAPYRINGYKPLTLQTLDEEI